ncbi:MAG: CPBP family intramembrane metalloprotease [Clostridia bacterium]|nr:CPBP family intramembrane metalloprotease [Clostridia bacterium]
MNQPMDNHTQNFNPQPDKPTYVTYIPYGFTPETFEERKNVRKTANTIGAALLILLAISEVAVYILRFILTVFNIWNTKTIAFISDPAFTQVFNAVFSVIMFTIPFIIVFKIQNASISGLIKFKKPKIDDILPYGLIGIGFCSVANLTVSYMGSFLSQFGIEYSVDYGDKPEGLFGFMLTFIAVAIVPPLVEEFACRGLILGSLRKYSDSFAVLTSAIVFGILHGNFQQMPFAFLVGLILGYATVKTKSIWTAVAIHAFNNAVSVVFDYAFIGESTTAKNIFYVVYLIISIFVGLLGVYLLKNRKGAYKLKKKKTSATKGQIYKWFFTTPTIVVFIVICVLKSLAFFG